jgi:hypothetical protein
VAAGTALRIQPEKLLLAGEHGIERVGLGGEIAFAVDYQGGTADQISLALQRKRCLLANELADGPAASVESIPPVKICS